MTLRLFGQVNSLGGGTHFGEFLEALRSATVPGLAIEAFDPGLLEPLAVAAAQSTPHDINLWFWPDQNATFFRGRKIVWGIFESTRLPPSYLSKLEGFDRVWVPSAWGRDTLISNGFSGLKIDVVPEGVNPKIFAPIATKAGWHDRSNRPFRFLTIGKYEERKCYPLLLDAFGATFGNQSQIELMIKADFFLNHHRKRQQLEGEVASRNLRNVSLVWGDWPQTALSGAYQEADAFVLPTRAEGWGLPLIEALACGTPVLTTYHGGQSEFLSALSGKFREIAYSMTPIRDPEFLRYWPGIDALGGEWAEPDFDSLCAGLSEVIKSHSLWTERARAASEIIRRDFSWERAAEKAILVLRELGWIR
jgi:glycosyltransferase involved in cell wall biosynthesis